MAGNFVFLNGSPVEGKTARFVELCEAFATYIRNNQEALIDYGRRQRDGKPISTPRAEGMANHMVNARMNKRQHMRWSRAARIGCFRFGRLSSMAISVPRPSKSRLAAPGLNKPTSSSHAL
jgi:hypothetical protein